MDENPHKGPRTGGDDGGVGSTVIGKARTFCADGAASGRQDGDADTNRDCGRT